MAPTQRNQFYMFFNCIVSAIIVFFIMQILDKVENIVVRASDFERLPQANNNNVTYTLEEPKNVTLLNSTIRFKQTDKIFAVLKDFFVPEQQDMFHKLLLGETVTEKLLFLGQSNQLAHAFRELHAAQIIPGSTKQDMIAWIEKHFFYRSNAIRQKEFKIKSLHDCISTNTKPCKNPIIKVESGAGQLEIILLSRTDKNFQKN